MITIQTLQYLIKNKLKDAEILYQNNRYAASIYLAGYAVEIALKYKICKSLQFNAGFPENKQELHNYLLQLNRNNPQPLSIELKQIRNHDLPALLFYSGAEPRVKNNLHTEWATANTWEPQERYKKIRIIKARNELFLKAVKKIIKEVS